MSAAQWKRRNGSCARFDAATSASATRSLPVPLSPVSSTVTSRGAIRCTSTASFDIAGDVNTNERDSVSSPDSRSTSAFSRTDSVARATTAIISSASNGFLK